MRSISTIIFCFLLALPVITFADDLTRMAQEELNALGYDVGKADGEAGTMTIIAISQFQAEQGLEVTGEVTPQLIGSLKAAGNKKGSPGKSTTVAATQMTPEEEEQDLRRRQQECLQEKQAAAQQRAKTARGFGKLLSAVTRTSNSYGGGELAGDISSTSREIYDANATVTDLSGAAKDLGLTDDEVEACRNPPRD